MQEVFDFRLKGNYFPLLVRVCSRHQHESETGSSGSLQLGIRGSWATDGQNC